LKRLQLLLALTVLCALAITAVPTPAGAAKSRRGDRMMDAINWTRAQAGLRPLRRSRRLVRSSRARAELMMRADFFAHPTRLSVPTFDRVGEVLELHGGRRPQTRAVLRRWGNSPGHRGVILSSAYRWMGAARAVGRYSGGRATIWVVRFGRH
jgi:uncharacterized protein YkwD